MRPATQYLNELYRDITYNSPEVLFREIPSDIGRGQIRQTKTKQGIAISDWRMEYLSDMNVQGVAGSEYIQMMFCFHDGVAWESAAKPRLIELGKGESCIYRCTDAPEHICYPKGHDFHFKSLKIPVRHLEKILDEYFEERETEALKKKLYAEPSKIGMNAHMEKILNEMADSVHYKGGLGYLYLESKVLELVSVYLSELLGLTNAGRDISLSVMDMEALIRAKQIIDEHVSAAPTCEALARQVNLQKGF